MSYHQSAPYPDQSQSRGGPAASYANSQFYGGGPPPPLPQRPTSGGYFPPQGSPPPNGQYSQQPPYPMGGQQVPYPSPGYSSPGYPPPQQYQQPPPQQYPPQGYPPQQQYPPQGYPPQQQQQYPPQQYQNQQYPPQQQLTPQPAPSPYASPSPYPSPSPGYMPSYSTNEWTKNHKGPKPPPNTMQSYSDGKVTHQYQMSTCQGKRKALLIGINYYGSKRPLQGCINDVNNIRAFLEKNFKYKPEDMVILTDDQNNPMNIPTKANIIRAMQWLVKNAQPNDSLFLHFSGHGGQTKDLDGDEADGYDETIYPVDYLKHGQIVDDQMHDILVRPLQPGVRLTAIFDSCHSGTALDLPYIYSTAGTLKEQNLLKEAGQGLMSAFSSYQKRDMGGFFQSGVEFFNKAAHGRRAEEKAKQTKSSPADVIQWSGSKDAQTSSDDMGGGVMSRAFVKVMTKHPGSSYKQMLNYLREELSGKYAQKPQLSSSHPIDTDLLFLL